ncbi:putative RNA-directed DNA polymerase, partial [Aphis craccivora]
MCRSYLAQRINWKVLPDIYSSDHLPILTKFMTRIGDTNTNKNHRWNLKAPNWTLFSDIIEEEITKIQHNDHPNIEHPVKMLTDIITSAAEISIGSFINHNKKPKVPWWNDEIKRAISNKKNALNTYKKKFTTSINIKTNASKIWNKIHSLKGLNRNQEIHISDAQGTTSSPEDVADKIGIYFQANFSNEIYKKEFIDGIKTSSENSPIISTINPKNSDQIDLNSSITFNEMETALNKCQRKSPGPDSIPYCFIINLGKIAKKLLLDIYNNIWHSGVISKEWKKGIIIPILKPGKNKHTTEGYRPITLLNTMTKIMEKIINLRLIWFLEKNEILSKEQSGFRHSRSTMDNLITIKTEIENAFKHKQILGMISLDITKAYDSVWRHRILSLLSKILTNGNMFKYITNFLKERQFQVKVSHTLSKTFNQENGIPQGSSLAVTLFLLAINEIVETIKVPVKANLFADDFNIYCRSNNLKTVQELLQIRANSLTDWSKKTGFSFSNLKSQNNQDIPHHNKIKTLGITFDSKLNWVPHLKNIRDSISQKLNIIKIISHTSWGGDSSSLLMIYKTLIRSKTDYGSILIKNAKTNHLNMIQTKLNTAIRLSIGGFKSSPIESIRNIANEIPSNLRREKLLLLYCARTKRNINNPANK